MPKWELPKKDDGGDKPAKKEAQLPVIKEPRCKVCQSEYRHLVDQMLVNGVSYSEIARQFEFAGMERRSISNHKDRHLGYEEAGIRQIIEREAIRAQKNFEEGKERVITKQAYLQIALQKAYDQLVANINEIPVKDAVAVIETLSKMESQHQHIALDELQIQFNAFLQAVKEVVPKEFWESVVLRTQELLKASGRGVNFDEDTTVPSDTIDVPAIEERTQQDGSDDTSSESGPGTPSV